VRSRSEARKAIAKKKREKEGKGLSVEEERKSSLEEKSGEKERKRLCAQPQVTIL
jgi:hypothetical protein